MRYIETETWSRTDTAVDTEERAFLIAAIEEHNGRCQKSIYSIRGIFTNEDDYTAYDNEVAAYHEQQHWLDMHTNDTGVNLGAISPSGIPDFGDLYINQK